MRIDRVYNASITHRRHSQVDTQRELEYKRSSKKMIIPVRCFTCGKVIGNKWETYLSLLQADLSEGYVSFHTPNTLGWVGAIGQVGHRVDTFDRCLLLAWFFFCVSGWTLFWNAMLPFSCVVQCCISGLAWFHAPHLTQDLVFSPNFSTLSRSKTTVTL